MGQEIKGTSFTQDDYDRYYHNLKEETNLLLEAFKNNKFQEPSPPLCGLEMEAWLINKDSLPNPIAEDFLKKMDDELIVPEISQFNFEINTEPKPLTNKVFSLFHKELKNTVQRCRDLAKGYDSKALFIGSLPTIRKYMLDMEYIYPNMRYYALNDQIIHLRHKQDMTVEIKGIEELEETFSNIMLECAATSLQLHLQIEPKLSKEYYNGSLLASPFMAAVSANSPFLFGKALWSETRIAIFEQAVKLDSYKKAAGHLANRVNFGSGYVKECLSEIYLENIDKYEALLPECFEGDPMKMKHVNFHNGTIWRWNRPIVGLGDDGLHHLRMEHRVPSSGPSITDMVADMALYIGLCHYFAHNHDKYVNHIPFETLKKNFYESCKRGFEAGCKWTKGKHSIKSLLLADLLPKAKEELLKMGVCQKDCDHYFDDVLKPRVESGHNGSNWQKTFISYHGPRFQELVEAYARNQSHDKPVHTWTI